MSAGQVPQLQDSPPSVLRLTETGAAALFAEDHADAVRFCDGFGWLVWDGSRWEVDKQGQIERLARETVRRMYLMASRESDSDRREKIAKLARACDSHRGIKAILALAQSELALTQRSDAFDRNPYLLNCGSGVIDLKTGNCAEHDPEALITKVARSFYRPSGKCPQWLAFLDTVMGGNAELVEYLQRVGGYALTGDTGEQCLFLLYGTGANGKSTFLEVLRLILGDYAKSASPETFMSRPNDSARSDLARLRGARMVSTIETDDGKRLAEGLVKQITGGDPLVARFLYHDEFEFLPQFKLFLATNHKPDIRSTDHAIWRRIRLIPFTVQIPEQDRIPNLALKLAREEGAAILAWLVQGCLEWQETKLNDPQCVIAATASYRAEQDALGDFIRDECITGDTLIGQGLYAAYSHWCSIVGEHPMAGKKFGGLLTERGFSSLGRSRYAGIALRSAV